jgi:hypothetical protein
MIEEQEQYLDIPFVSPIHQQYDNLLSDRALLAYLARSNKSQFYSTIYDDLLEELNEKISSIKKEEMF